MIKILVFTSFRTVLIGLQDVGLHDELYNAYVMQKDGGARGSTISSEKLENDT